MNQHVVVEHSSSASASPSLPFGKHLNMGDVGKTDRLERAEPRAVEAPSVYVLIWIVATMHEFEIDCHSGLPFLLGC
jgi:hypothetical protein